MPSRPLPLGRVWDYFDQSRLVRILRYRDFRLLWIGAFVSFTGSWVTRIAQGYFVYQITHDGLKLAIVSFAGSFPVLVLGLVAGSFSDRFDKRIVLIWTQIIFAASSIYLAAATYFNFIQYWHIVAIAFLNGTVGSVEMPTRQSIVSRVVPPEELAAAVPVNAMTFNVARIMGPVIGGFVLAKVGVAACYLVDGLSFLALIWTAFTIRSNLKPLTEERGPLKDLIFEGALYTFKDIRLRALFLLESLTACFGLAYLPLLPAYVPSVLHIPGPDGLRDAYFGVGLGALIGLGIAIRFADYKKKGRIIQAAMAAMSLGLICLGFVHVPFIAYCLLGLVGLAGIIQLNTTNALFQMLSPDRLRGRVLAMHIWALNGLAPFGVLACGYLASEQSGSQRIPGTPFQHGIPLAFSFAGCCMLVGAVGALLSRRGLSGLFV